MKQREGLIDEGGKEGDKEMKLRKERKRGRTKGGRMEARKDGKRDGCWREREGGGVIVANSHSGNMQFFKQFKKKVKNIKKKREDGRHKGWRKQVGVTARQGENKVGKRMGSKMEERVTINRMEGG